MASDAVSIYPYGVTANCTGCGSPLVKPNFTFWAVAQPDRPGQRGTFLFVDERYADSVQITLRAQDVSRQSQTWGTLIPVVREQHFSNRPFSLPDIPIDSRFRQSIRVYALDGTRPAAVRISVYGLYDIGEPQKADVLLGSRDYPLTLNATVRQFAPGFLEIGGVGVCQYHEQ
ncbi:MAG: hypothetical protein M3P29_01305 [Acidobacteriota bacterium]|nr:hypothetical protein [Acidobacteriota bacterium]